MATADDPSKFYTDEHVDKTIVVQLQAQGVDIIRCQDAGLRTADDPDHLAAASREKRTLITRDKDFLRLHAQWIADGREHSGIIFLDSELSIGQIMGVIKLFDEVVPSAEMKNQVRYAKQFLLK